MRRQFKLGFGGWLAATAAALGQTPPQQPVAVQPIRYVTPFSTQANQAQAQAMAQSQAVQANQYTMPGNRLQGANVQYVPLQTLAGGQYTTIQPVSNTGAVKAQPV